MQEGLAAGTIESDSYDVLWGDDDMKLAEMTDEELRQTADEMANLPVIDNDGNVTEAQPDTVDDSNDVADILSGDEGVSRRNFLRGVFAAGAGAAALSAVGVDSAEAAKKCRRGEKSHWYKGRHYCSPITRGKAPEMTKSNVRRWSIEHDRYSNMVARGKKLSEKQCIRFQWLDRRWEDAYKKGLTSHRPPWRRRPNRFKHLKKA